MKILKIFLFNDIYYIKKSYRIWQEKQTQKMQLIK